MIWQCSTGRPPLTVPPAPESLHRWWRAQEFHPLPHIIFDMSNGEVKATSIWSWSTRWSDRGRCIEKENHLRRTENEWSDFIQFVLLTDLALTSTQKKATKERNLIMFSNRFPDYFQSLEDWNKATLMKFQEIHGNVSGTKYDKKVLLDN